MKAVIVVIVCILASIMVSIYLEPKEKEDFITSHRRRGFKPSHEGDTIIFTPDTISVMLMPQTIVQADAKDFGSYMVSFRFQYKIYTCTIINTQQERPAISSKGGLIYPTRGISTFRKIKSAHPENILVSTVNGRIIKISTKELGFGNDVTPSEILWSRK